MTTSATSVRMDDELKKEVNERLEKLGLSFNTFVVMASKQLVAQNKLPFSTEVPPTESYEQELELLRSELDRGLNDLIYHRDKAVPLSKIAENVGDYHLD